MIDVTSQVIVFLSILIFIPLGSSLTTNSIDWCEYWARVGKKVSNNAILNAIIEQVAKENQFLKADRPECAGYELPNGFKRSETFSCSKTEIYNCLDCEPTCHNLVPKCRKEQCNKGCVCKNGLARNAEGKCVTLRECAAQSPPRKDSSKGEEEDGTVMKTVKKMVPVIVNDVWKALFNSISVPETTTSKTKNVITPVLTPVDVDSKKINHTDLLGFDIKDEKQPQKGFYIDYP